MVEQIKPSQLIKFEAGALDYVVFNSNEYIFVVNIKPMFESNIVDCVEIIPHIDYERFFLNGDAKLV